MSGSVTSLPISSKTKLPNETPNQRHHNDLSFGARSIQIISASDNHLCTLLVGALAVSTQSQDCRSIQWVRNLSRHPSICRKPSIPFSLLNHLLGTQCTVSVTASCLLFTCGCSLLMTKGFTSSGPDGVSLHLILTEAATPQEPYLYQLGARGGAWLRSRHSPNPGLWEQ